MQVAYSVQLANDACISNPSTRFARYFYVAEFCCYLTIIRDLLRLEPASTEHINSCSTAMIVFHGTTSNAEHKV